MEEIFKTYTLEIIIAVITTILTTIAGLWIKHLYKKMNEKEEQAKKLAEEKIAEEKKKAEEKRKEYERLSEEDKVRTQRKIILEELEPIVDEMNNIKSIIDGHVSNVETHIKEDEEKFKEEIKSVKNYHDCDKKEVDAHLRDLAEKHEYNLTKIRESYKFRFIQLCRTHLREGYITENDWEQIVAFYDLYHSLGGNGQAEDYYNKVKELEVIPDIVE